jgi:methionyl-tRNA formyltransferase
MALVMEDQSMSRSSSSSSSSPLRILLFAHHHAGLAALHGLREAGHEIVACYTHPQTRPWAPSLAHSCAAAGIPCSLNPPAAEDAQRYRDPRPNLIVCIGYRRRVTLPFLALPRWGAINAHLAPLPQYRGANPIPWGILNGMSNWAVTIHAMTHNYNEGGVLRHQPVALRETDNAYDLFLRSSQVAVRTLLETVAEIASGGGDLVAQDLRQVSFYDDAVPYGGYTDWNQTAASLAAFVRALDFGRGHVDGMYEHLAAPATATIAGQRIGIWRARAGGTMSPYPPGTITRCDGEVWVQTGRGHLVIERLCDSSGRDHVAAEFFAAKGITPGQSFDTTHAWRKANPTPLLGFAA